MNQEMDEKIYLFIKYMLPSFPFEVDNSFYPATYDEKINNLVGLLMSNFHLDRLTASQYIQSANLMKLQEMRDSGTITQQVYENKKAAIIQGDSYGLR